MKMKLSSQDDLIIVGTGTLACHCVAWLKKKTTGKIFVFESGDNFASMMKTQLSAIPDVMYDTVGTDIEQRIMKLHPKIIFSIGNRYIFQPQLIACCPILNYHNALLPFHPGRNAEAWTIYEQDPVTGVTWHFVSERVDKGSIILQKEILLDDTVTSVKLLQKQSELAFSMFQKIFNEIVTKNELITSAQKKKRAIKHHYSWERPNNGLLDIDWPAEKISAFLRAMDYGKLSCMGRPVMEYKGRTLCWQRYIIEKTTPQKESVSMNDSTLQICKPNHTICLLGVKDLKEKGAEA